MAPLNYGVCDSGQQSERKVREIPQYEDLRAFIEDAGDLLTPIQLFGMGLVLGKTHGNLKLNLLLDTILKIGKLADKEMKKKIEEEMLMIGSEEDLERIAIKI